MKSAKIFTILVLGLMVYCQQVVLAGTIVGWGDNTLGKATPPSGSDYMAITAGGHHGLALKADGSIDAWGANDAGQTTVPAGNDFVATAAGLVFSLALKANGSIVGWGFNAYGQADPPAGSDYVAIAAGGWHSLAIKKDGSCVGWGLNVNNRATPPLGNDFVAIAADGHHSLALKADGTVVAWGISDGSAEDYGQVTDTPTGNDFIAVAAGWYHSLALKADGTIVAWGINDGSEDDYGQVTDTPTDNDFIAITAGHWHNLALKTDGTIIGWGRNNFGQTTSPPGNNYVAIAAGGDYSLGLTKMAVGTAFTYQGRLIDADYPADDMYDFRFKLYNDMTAGMQQGNTIYRDDIGVSDGYFKVVLDFGIDVFDSNALWLEIGVRPGDVNDPNLYTKLSPRQRITPTPYAVHASSSETVQTPLELSGSVAAPNSVMLVQNHHINGIAIRGENTNTGTHGYLGGNIDGVHGWGGLAGVMGQSSSGYGMWATSISGAAVYGEQFNSGNNGSLGTGNYGVSGFSSSGAAGYFTSDTGYGLLIDSGYVGIGTTSPMEELDVAGDVRINKNGGALILRTPSRNSPDRFSLRFQNNFLTPFLGDETQDQYFSFFTDFIKARNYSAHLRVHGQAVNSWGNYLEMTHDGNDAKISTDVGDIVLNPAGNVGIGVADPNHKLHVIGKDVDNYFETTGYFETMGYYARAVSGVASSTLAGINYGGYFTAGGLEGRGVYGEATAQLDCNNYGGYFKAMGFKGRGVYGSASNSADAINYGGFFEANGKSGRGVYGLATGSSGIGVYGEGELYDFYAHHGRTNYGAASSIRWKSNIQPIDNPLDKVLQLRGVYFDWDQEHGGEHDVGMIAEEVGKVLPEIVRYEEDGIYTSGMDYSKLTPLLIEAVKELKGQNDRLKDRVEALEKTIQQIVKAKEVQL